jgi:anti-anti-sigma factor
MCSYLTYRVQVLQVGGVTLVRLLEDRLGETIDDQVIHSLGQTFTTLVEREGHDRIVVNFAPVTFVSNYAMVHVVKLIRMVGKARGKLAFCCLHPHLKYVFEITRLSEQVALFDEEQAAVDACS